MIYIETNKKHVPNYELLRSEQLVKDFDDHNDSGTWLSDDFSELGDKIKIAVYVPEHTGTHLYLTTNFEYSIVGNKIRIKFTSSCEEHCGRLVITKVYITNINGIPHILSDCGEHYEPIKESDEYKAYIVAHRNQTDQWLLGNPIHNNWHSNPEFGECTPDMSCCGGQLWPKELRLEF